MKVLVEGIWSEVYGDFVAFPYDEKVKRAVMNVGLCEEVKAAVRIKDPEFFVRNGYRRMWVDLLQGILSRISNNQSQFVFSRLGIAVLNDLVTATVRRFLSNLVACKNLVQSRIITRQMLDSCLASMVSASFLPHISQSINYSLNQNCPKDYLTENISIFVQAEFPQIAEDFQPLNNYWPFPSVYLAVVLEYVFGEVIELTTNNARDNRRSVITPSEISFAIELDKDLSALFDLGPKSKGTIPLALRPLSCQVQTATEDIKSRKRRLDFKRDSEIVLDQNGRQRKKFRPGALSYQAEIWHETSANVHYINPVDLRYYCYNWTENTRCHPSNMCQCPVCKKLTNGLDDMNLDEKLEQFRQNMIESCDYTTDTVDMAMPFLRAFHLEGEDVLPTEEDLPDVKTEQENAAETEETPAMYGFDLRELVEFRALQAELRSIEPVFDPTVFSLLCEEIIQQLHEAQLKQSKQEQYQVQEQEQEQLSTEESGEDEQSSFTQEALLALQFASENFLSGHFQSNPPF